MKEINCNVEKCIITPLQKRLLDYLVLIKFYSYLNKDNYNKKIKTYSIFCHTEFKDIIILISTALYSVHRITIVAYSS